MYTEQYDIETELDFIVSVPAFAVFGHSGVIILNSLMREEHSYRLQNKLQGGWFQSRTDLRVKKTGLSYEQQVKAIKKLCKLGVITTQIYGEHRYYQMRHRRIVEILNDNNLKESNNSTTAATEIIEYWKKKKIDGQKLKYQAKRSVSSNASMIIEQILSCGYKDIPILTIEQIKQAIDNFALAALDLDYAPVDAKKKNKLKRQAIDRFFWNPFMTNPRYNKSQCVFFLHNKPKKCSVWLQEVAPVNEVAQIAADRLMTIYRTLIGDFSGHDKPKFVKGANMLVDFCVQNRLDVHQPAYSLAEDLVTSVKETFTDTVSVGNLCSDYTFKTILPTHLRSVGRLD